MTQSSRRSSAKKGSASRARAAVADKLDSLVRLRRSTPAAAPSVAIPPGEDGVLDTLFATQRHSLPGHTGARLVSRGSDAFALRALSARAAVRSLDLQYYIWHSDATGRLLAMEVLAAADRGVRVRLLLDDMDARSRDGILMALDQHPMIEIRLFNPFASRSGFFRTVRELFSRASRLNHRMHNKAWIADGRIALVGGRNVGDEYFAASSEVNFVDLDVVLLGDAVAQTVESFDRYWNSRSTVPIANLRRTARNRYTLSAIREAVQDAQARGEPHEYARRLSETPDIREVLAGEQDLIWSSRVEVVADDPRKALRDPQDIDPGVMQSIARAFENAREQLLLISPYFVPGFGGTQQLTRKAAQGIEVQVLTNSLAATDVAAVHAGYSKYRRALLEAGVRLFELKEAPDRDDDGAEEGERPRMHLGSSKASLHTKAAIVDSERVFVGSFNLDPRSATLNCEMGVWIADGRLAQNLRELFAAGATPRNSFVVTLDERGRMQWTEESGGSTVTYSRDPRASWARRCVTWLLRQLPIESQL